MLPFGIPQLDELFGYSEGIALPQTSPTDTQPPYQYCLDQTTSISIVGTDGTGKSIVALHMAAAYADIVKRHRAAATGVTPAVPYIIYASSDLQYHAASGIWENFCLRRPWRRFVPFISKNDLDWRRGKRKAAKDAEEIRLGYYVPLIEEEKKRDKKAPLSIANVLHKKPSEPEVSFLDLAGSTAGDDWLFLMRLLSLAGSERTGNDDPPNLLIVDSVAGFETLVGEKNSFGEEMSRRARVAQVIRTSVPEGGGRSAAAGPIRPLPEPYLPDVEIRSTTCASVATFCNQDEG
jgi:hypothetical protein